MTDPMPKMCTHLDPAHCTAECEEKVRQFDAWLHRHAKWSEPASVVIERVSKRARRAKLAGYAWAVVTLIVSLLNAAAWVVTGDFWSFAISLFGAAVALWLYGKTRHVR